MKLRELFAGAFSGAEAERDIVGLTMDSRLVEPGFVFVALSGSKAEGLSFVPDAVRRGAPAVLAETDRPTDLPAEVAFARVNDARRALALAAARLHPRQPSTIVAVTGTSGKSSVAEFARQIFAAQGHKAASLGTIGLVAPSGGVYGSLTTPDPVSLHATLDGLAGEGVTHLAIEASSHGLDQRRLDGVKLRAAAFTNLGRDHLDYHATVDDYLGAKMRLFDTLLPDGAIAVVNIDSSHGGAVLATASMRGLRTLAVGEDGDLRLDELTRDGFGQRLTVSTGGETRDVRLPLVGDFQASNALVAAGLAIAVGVPAERAIAALAGLKGVKGRMEQVAEVNGARIVIDYAHKPDALAHVLGALRPYVSARLVCVIGAGGDRDAGKRPLMGRVAAERADTVIVTDDNPRSEDPSAIRAAILAGARRMRDDVREIGDRGEAIRVAVRELEPGDVLVVAGKGHETGQIVGSRTLPFSDHDAVLSAVAETAA